MIARNKIKVAADGQNTTGEEVIPSYRTMSAGTRGLRWIGTKKGLSFSGASSREIEDKKKG